MLTLRFVVEKEGVLECGLIGVAGDEFYFFVVAAYAFEESLLIVLRPYEMEGYSPMWRLPFGKERVLSFRHGCKSTKKPPSVLDVGRFFNDIYCKMKKIALKRFLFLKKYLYLCSGFQM